MRLIDADAILKKQYQGYTRASDTDWQIGYWDGVDRICNEIREEKTVDAEPVTHGRWEWLGPYRYNNDGDIGTCSVCKRRIRFFEKPNYCPNCGAKMDVKIK